MGRLLTSLVWQHPEMQLVGAVEAAGHQAIGKDAGETAGIGKTGVTITADYGTVAAADNVTLDFTVAEAALDHLRTAIAKGAAIVIGTTGFSAEQRAEAEKIAPKTRCLIAPNMSVGVNVLFKVVADVAKILRDSFDVEILEIHHRFKADAPSGTALALARAVAEAQGKDLEKQGRYGRQGITGERTPDEIGIMALRGGDIVGDHTVTFAGFGERLELTHRAQSRECLARGALRAALWLPHQPPGLYAIKDVLGL
jgi:4-hydroxy-tetrahydrodipicolinate reductase